MFDAGRSFTIAKLWLLVLGIFPCSVYSQKSRQSNPGNNKSAPAPQQNNKRIRFEHLTVADGLPENSVRTMMQDHLGYMWMGTQNGLARYDGTTLTAFEHNSANPRSLKGRLILALHEDKNGDIWIGSESLFRFERSTQRFIEYPREKTYRKGETTVIGYIHEDKSGNIWTITQNFNQSATTLEKFNPQKKTWTYFGNTEDGNNPAVKNIFFDNTNYGFVEDKAGTIWITITGESGNFLQWFDRKAEKFVPFLFSDDRKIGPDFNKVDGLAFGKDGLLYLSSLIGGGLFILNTGTGQIRQIKRTHRNNNSLICDTTQTIYADHQGLIWISTPLGIDAYNPNTQTFRHYRSDITDPETPSPGFLRSPVESEDGNLWFITDDGMNYFDRGTDRFIRYERNVKQQDGLLSASARINKALIDRSGLLWVGSQGSGVNKESRVNIFSLITKTAGNPNSLQDSNVNVIYEAPSEPGIIWFGTNTGLDRYDKKTGAFVHYRHDDHTKTSLSKERVTGITEDKNGRFWVATHQGLNLMDREKETFTFFTHNPSDVNSLGHEHITCLTPASNGTLWIGTDAGLGHFDFDNKKFVHYVEQDTSYTPELFDLIGEYIHSSRQVAAILHCGINADETVSFNVPEAAELLVIGLGAMDVQKFDYGWIEDAAGKIVWEMDMTNTRSDGVGRIRAEVSHFEKGTYRLRYKTDKNYAYKHWGFVPPYHPELFGIQVMKIKNAEAIKFNEEAQKRVTNGLADNTISCITEDARGNVWIGTNVGGVNKFDPVTKKFIIFKDYYKGPFCIPGSIMEEGTTGKFWIGDFINGLLLLDSNGKILNRYTSSNGLPGNSVFGIQKDHSGHLWISTNNGLCRLEPTTGQTVRYDQSNGLQSTNFSPMSFTRSSDGEIYFGGTKGVNVFFPEKIKIDTVPPKIILNDLFIAGKLATLGPGGQMPVHISLAKNITLPYNQNDLTFHYTALQFNRGNECRYAYKLSPNDDEWIQAGTLRQVRYTDLAPGTYTFTVKAANADNVWNEKGTSFTLIILPPWWKTWWAYGMYILAAGGVIWYYIAWRENSLKARHKELEQTVIERTAEVVAQKERAERSEKFKQQFLANMSHEIRTPMNAVMGMTNLVLDSQLDSQQKFYLEAIKNSSDTLLHIINDILDLSKIEAGRMEIEKLDFSIREMMEQVQQLLQFEADKKQLSLTVDIESHVPYILMGDPLRLKQVLINLAGNALKFTHQGGVTINVRYRDSENELSFSITDTGIGIPENKLKTVFESFAQVHASDTREFGGTGLGLTISRQFVELMGGSLSVESEEGAGTTFSFQINCPAGSAERLYAQKQLQNVDGKILNGLKILIVDDNDYNRIVVRDTLQLKADVEITAATNGKEALELLKQKDFDVILMDVQMPVMDGYEATRRIRTEFGLPKSEIPIIALTASVIRSDLDKCRDAGMNDYVPKPFRTSHLISVIAKTQGKKVRLSGKENVLPAASQVKPAASHLSYLENFCEGDKIRMQKYINMFLETAPVLIARIQSALNKNDYEEVAAQVHGYKTKLIMMGMNKAQDLVSKIEKEHHEGLTGEIKGNVDRLLEEIENAVAELKN